MTSTENVHQHEIHKFGSQAEHWWDPDGDFMTLHAVNPLHIVFNMLLLWWLGSELERLWGSRFFTLFYFVSGIGASFRVLQ